MFECYHRGQPIVGRDLAKDAGRWPTFAPAAVGRGFGSVQAFVMGVRGTTAGALNLFRAHPGVLSARDLRLGQGMADIAAVALSQERSVRESRDLSAQLQGALISRVVIEQAKGVLAERAQIDMDAAFARAKRVCGPRRRDTLATRRAGPPPAMVLSLRSDCSTPDAVTLARLLLPRAKGEEVGSVARRSLPLRRGRRQRALGVVGAGRSHDGLRRFDHERIDR